MILSVILFHWWGDHGCTKELFRWSDVCSRLTGENWVNCWKWGDQWDGIWQDRNDSNTGIVYIQHVSLSETVTENNFTASRGAILRFSPHTGDMRHTTPIVCRCGCGPKKRKFFYQISKYIASRAQFYEIFTAESCDKIRGDSVNGYQKFLFEGIWLPPNFQRHLAA